MTMLLLCEEEIAQFDQNTIRGQIMNQSFSTSFNNHLKDNTSVLFDIMFQKSGRKKEEM